MANLPARGAEKRRDPDAPLADLVERDDEGFFLTGPGLIRNGQRPKNWKPKRDP